jgi:lysophospholipase L1-like esterase
MKIAFLGDSLTWGGYGGNFVELIAAQMPEHEIINAGAAGDTVVNLLRRVEAVIDEHAPEAMFVMVGGNDAVSYTTPAVRPYYKASKKLEDGMVSPELFASTYRDLLIQIQLRHVLPLVGLAPTEYNRVLVEARRQYNALTREIASSLNIPILDLDAVFTPAQPIARDAVTLDFIRQIGERARTGWNDFETERQKWGYTYTFDGMHLTPASAQKFADLIVPFLRENL